MSNESAVFHVTADFLYLNWTIRDNVRDNSLSNVPMSKSDDNVAELIGMPCGKSHESAVYRPDMRTLQDQQ